MQHGQGVVQGGIANAAEILRGTPCRRLMSEYHIFQNGRSRKERSKLCCASYAETNPVRELLCGDVGALEEYLTAVRGQKAAYQADERCLAGTIRPDHRMDLVRPQVDRYVLGHAQRAKPLVQMFCFQDGLNHGGARIGAAWRRAT